MRLTAKAAQHAPIGWHGDGRGLYLQCTASADGSINRSWVYRYGTKSRYLGLGPLADVSLAEAREKAAAARKLRLNGVDPIDARKAQRNANRLEAAKAMTFAQCADAYIETHEAAWGNATHRHQWRMTLTEYCKPIANLPVKDVDTDLILRTLTPLWTARTQTAKRLRGRIERVLAWAKGRGLRDGENPARWLGHLDEMLPSPAKIAAAKHHAALAYAEISEFMTELRTRDSLPALALEFTILTAARTGEVAGATWGEFDLNAAIWTIPAERMKAGAQHKVPLSDRALNILRELPRNGDRGFAQLTRTGMIELLRKMRPGLTVHGFRSCFMDWAHEITNFPKVAIDMALAHKVGDKVEAAYRRGDLFEKRRKLMQSWADFCGQPIVPAIIPFHRASGLFG
jgi:integrase